MMEKAPAPPVIRKEILRDKIFEVLKGWILDGTLRPGERIVESALAARLKVSRAPFREALWLLARHGLVVLEAHHGAFVARLSESDIREIFEIRQALEILCARKIRETLTPARAARLREALKELEDTARRRDMGAFSEADRKFHGVLAELAGNRRVEEILRDLSSRFFGYELIRDLPKAAHFRFKAVLEEHRQMVRLILEGNDRDIDAGFKRAFAAFLEYVLERFREPDSLPEEDPS